MGKLSQENRMLQCSGSLLQQEQEMAAAQQLLQVRHSGSLQHRNEELPLCRAGGGQLEVEVGVDADSQLLMCMVAVG